MFFWFFSLTTEQWNRACSRWAVRLAAAWTTTHVSICSSLHCLFSSPLPPFTQLLWKTSHNCWSMQLDLRLIVFSPRRGLNARTLSPARPSATISSLYKYLTLTEKSAQYAFALTVETHLVWQVLCERFKSLSQHKVNSSTSRQHKLGSLICSLWTIWHSSKLQ